MIKYSLKRKISETSMGQTKRSRERMQPGQKIVEEEWSEMATKLIIGNYGVVPYSFCIVSLLFKPVKLISEKNFIFVWPSLDVHSFLAI